MNVLFVSSGNNINGISPIIKNQGLSLEEAGCEVDYFTIKGKGFLGYLKNVPRLRRVLKEKKPNVVHAHYSLCGFAATLAGVKHPIVSLMGSDVKSESKFRPFILFLSRRFWGKTIVKSQDMKETLGLPNVEVVPNGVDLNRFKPLNKEKCQKEIGWFTEKKHILFAGNPKREVKNFSLAKEAFNSISIDELELHCLENTPHGMMPLYYNASDLVLLTSKWEGSPNVIKEAMACNRPIVSTDVGDVRFIFGNIEGCFITSFDTEKCVYLINEGLKIQETEGRKRIKRLKLDAQSISEKLLIIYRRGLER